MACKTCELECAVIHSRSGELFQALQEIPPPAKRIFVEAHQEVNVPLQCRHCEDPPCAKICPTSAITKNAPGEPVLLNEEKCIGCKYCLLVCPFGVVVLRHSDGALIKCDLCVGADEGRKTPRCVESCPTQALRYVSPEELAQEKRREFMVEYLP